MYSTRRIYSATSAAIRRHSDYQGASNQRLPIHEIVNNLDICPSDYSPDSTCAAICTEAAMRYEGCLKQTHGASGKESFYSGSLSMSAESLQPERESASDTTPCFTSISYS